MLSAEERSATSAFLLNGLEPQSFYLQVRRLHRKVLTFNELLEFVGFQVTVTSTQRAQLFHGCLYLLFVVVQFGHVFFHFPYRKIGRISPFEINFRNEVVPFQVSGNDTNQKNDRSKHNDLLSLNLHFPSVVEVPTNRYGSNCHHKKTVWK